jgi:fatty-acid peroxygenase
MKNIPRDKNIDSTLPLLLNGYPFMQERFHQNHSNVFKTRFMGQKAICIHGAEATKVFYDEDKFQRKGALPKRVQNTLLGKQGIHTKDDEVHKNRKVMFMSLMSPERIQQLMDIMGKYWQAYISKWEKMDKVVLFHESQEILCRAICEWSGVPLKEKEVKERSRDFWKMVDAFGGVGPRHWRGKRARNRTGKWIKAIIKDVRSGKLQAPVQSAANVVAMHRDRAGNLLDKKIAAVELINVLRPTVAISYFIAFAALALHKYPMYRQKVLEGDEKEVEYFVQEVRRFFPFAPILGAITRKDFDWQGFQFKKGRMVLLDVFGNLHDDKLWDNPSAFLPERFKNWQESAYDMIPQGGGNPYISHRCPGEWLTIESMKVAVNCLVKGMEYKVPDQDFSFSMKRMPTYPKSGFIITEVKRTQIPAPTVKVPQCPFHDKIKV